MTENENIILGFLEKCNGDDLLNITNLLNDLSLNPEQHEKEMLSLIRDIVNN